ncbi:hypothetical protein [Streptomyces sp. AHA2]|uniref:hypothetical protein n=1 Tax=Streptomyces sp. AHA2 TaxID=3064526 RepID=UPI002FE3F693
MTELFTEVTKARKVPLQKEVVDHIKTAHRQALASSNRKLHEVQQLQDQLEDADLRVQQAAIREQVLMEGLQLREQRIAQLEVKQLELTARWENETRQREALANELALTEDSYAEELERLKAEVEQLRADLRRAKEESQQAEARCQLLEERLTEAEERASTGQEAREASELEAAQRAVAEARAVADDLRRQLEDIQVRRNVRQEALADEVAAALDRELQEEKERERYVVETEPEEIARELMRLYATGGDAGVYDMANTIGRLTPGQSVRELCTTLWEKNYTDLAVSVAGHLSDREDLEALADILILIGGQDVSRMANRCVERALGRVAWFRDSFEVLSFARILKEKDWAAWASQLEEECAARRDANKLAELISIMSLEDRASMLTSVVENRSTPDVPALLSQMSRVGLGDEVQSILTEVENIRPADHPFILEAWSLVNQ